MGNQLGWLRDKDLAYFTEDAEHFDDYVEAADWAQDYAMFNRREMMRLIIDALANVLPRFKATKEAINCQHNEEEYLHTIDRSRRKSWNDFLKSALLQFFSKNKQFSFSLLPDYWVQYAVF